MVETVDKIKELRIALESLPKEVIINTKDEDKEDRRIANMNKLRK